MGCWVGWEYRREGEGEIRGVVVRERWDGRLKERGWRV